MIICKLSTRLTTFASTHFFLATFVFLRVKTASASERVRKPTCSSSNIFRILFLRLFLFLFFHTSNHCPFPQTSEITRVVSSVRQSREFFSSSLLRIDYNTYKTAVGYTRMLLRTHCKTRNARHYPEIYWKPFSWVTSCVLVRACVCCCCRGLWLRINYDIAY